MKHLILPLTIAAALGISVKNASADVLAQWTFESLTLTSTAGTTPPVNNFAPEVGAGEASGLHASSAAVWSTPAGNGSAKSFSVNNWGVGDYFQFKVSTVGYSGIGVSFDHTGSGTGPRDFELSYSTDGSSFTSFANYTVLLNGTPPPSWNFTTPNPNNSYLYDLSAITAIDNEATVYLRLVNTSTVSINGGTIGTGGTSRVDNFTVFSPVPEPSTATLALLGGLLSLWRVRRRA